MHPRVIPLLVKDGQSGPLALAGGGDVSRDEKTGPSAHSCCEELTSPRVIRAERTQRRRRATIRPPAARRSRSPPHCRATSRCSTFPTGSSASSTATWSSPGWPASRVAAARRSSSRPTIAYARSTSTPCATLSARTCRKRAFRCGRPRPPCGTATRASRPTSTPTPNCSTWPVRWRACQTCRWRGKRSEWSQFYC